MDKDQILDLLRTHRTKLAQYGTKSLALFGSYARGESRQDSDINLLIEFDAPPTFETYMDLKFYLEDLLGHAVDLVPRRTLKPRIRPAVEQEAIHVT